MFFGPANVPGTAAHRRKTYANTNAITDYEADLTSRDREKQKHAVRRYINETIKGDWEWEWPQPLGGQDDSDTHSLNDPEIEWKERDEWLSDNSEPGDSPPIPGSAIVFDTKMFKSTPSPFRFENPDGVGETIQKSQRDRKRRRKRRNKEEMKYNDGVRCFNERRDAWTRARHVPAPPRKRSVQTNGSSEGDGSSTAVDNEDDDGWEDSDTEIPIAPPLLPPTNAMRASIKPDAYSTIYDKVVMQQLTPSCPMNLSDVVRSCVQGWKRDGEWPPKVTQPDPVAGKKKPRKLSVAGIFGLDKDKDGQKEPGSPGTLRRSLQRFMSLGKDHDKFAPSPATPGLQGSEKSKEVEKVKEDTLKPPFS
ncbi:hypothetical protein BJ875DRAFT_475762 [Amylocarpus encephaloides]|uniref:Gag1-like clamp domain-containing protein n=1 Tax=Amylocarpus encephaloides TaxID=45428 RepID=A0A9P7Y8K4_9HELO|nr:hypothetical protein BJ875DRAFT_475762 [Amylocarpus encephaloides]